MTLFQASRYIEKAVSLDSGTTVTFPHLEMEIQDSGPLGRAYTELPGRNYGFDHYRNARSPRKIGRISVRFLVYEDTPTLTDTLVDSLRSTLLEIGPMWLYSLGADGTRRKVQVRLAAVPEYSLSYGGGSIVPKMVLDFEKLDDWCSENLVTGSQAISATPTSFTIANPGLLTVEDAVFRLRAGAANFFTNPILENLTNGYSLSSLRDASNANHELKYDLAAPSVRWSTDDGATYADDLANLVMPTTEVPLTLPLQPGNNSMRATNTGTPGYTLEWAFYARW